MSSVASPLFAGPLETQPRVQGEVASRELSLMLTCAVPHAGPERLAQVGDLLQHEINWPQVVSLADRHGLISLLYQNLAPHSGAMPPSVLEDLRARFEQNARQALWLTQLLSKILDHLRTHSVRAMPYKGPVLAVSLYGNLAHRQFCDLDILIRPDDVSRAKLALAKLGLVPHEHLSPAEEKAHVASGNEYVFDRAGNRNLVEIQWRILPRFYAVEFDVDGFFARATTVDLGSLQVSTLCPEDLLLVLCVHAAKHLWEKLSWICDIAQLAASPAINWDHVKHEAERLGIERIVAVSFYLAQKLLGSPVPQIYRDLQSDPEVESIGSRICQSILRGTEHNLEAASYFRLILRLRERRRDKLRFLARLAFTPSLSEWSLIRLPAPLFPLYRIVRLFRLIGKLKPTGSSEG